jgi:hypothetical protein
MSEDSGDLTETLTQSAASAALFPAFIHSNIVSGNATALLENLIEGSAEAQFTSLVHGLEAAYETEPAATTTTLAHTLQLASKDCSAETAAEVTVAALIAGGVYPHHLG